MTVRQQTNGREPAVEGPLPALRPREVLFKFIVLLVLPTLLYLVFVLFVERLPGTPQPDTASLAAVLVMRAEQAYHVLRHLIPVFLGWAMGYLIVANLVYYFYDLRDRPSAARKLNPFDLFGRRSPSLGVQPITITSSALAERNKENALLWAGGPGWILVPQGHVVTTELNSRFHRTLPAGRHHLDFHETVCATLDLRPQERSEPAVRLRSRDSVEVSALVSVIFRIKTGLEDEPTERSFHFDPDAVRELAYFQSNMGDSRIDIWENLPLRIAKSALAEKVASFALDELRVNQRAPNSSSHALIRDYVRDRTAAELDRLGIELIRLRIGEFHLPEFIISQYISVWQTMLSKRTRPLLSTGQSISLREGDLARAEAELEFLEHIVQHVEIGQESSLNGADKRVAARQCLEVLNKLAEKAAPDDPLREDLLLRLHELRNRLA